MKDWESQIEDEWELSLLPSQISKFNTSPSSPEEVIAWRFLALLILDCAGSDRRILPAKRLQNIEEVERWIDNDASEARFQPGKSGFEWTFEHFCEVINQDESYFRRKLSERLRNWKRSAQAAEEGFAYLGRSRCASSS